MAGMTSPTRKTLVAPGNGALAMLEQPAADATRAVLLIPPLFEERKATLPLLAALSRTLAQNGALTARCDVAGTGHADGGFEDLTPALWQGGLLATAEFLRSLAPGVPLFVVGVRISCAWAAWVSREVPGVAGVVFIAPAQGPRLLRQLAQRSAVNQMSTHGRALLPPGKIAAEVEAGRTLDLDGYAVTPALYRALEAQAIQPCACQALLLATPHDGPDAQACGATKTVAINLPAFWNTVGHVDTSPIVDAVCGWLAGQQEGVSKIFDVTPHPSAFALASTLGTLHGFRYAPANAPRSKVLFIHGWSGDGTGPHRMYVKLARRLVASGCLCHTFDLGGRGDSDGVHGAASIASMAADARVAFEHLDSFAPGAPSLVVAMCSGSKVALLLAAEGVKADLALFSAEPLGALRDGRRVAWRKLCHALGSYAFKLTQPQTWKKLFTGKVQAAGVRSALASSEKPSEAEVREETVALKKLRNYKGRILFVFAERDPEAAPSRAAYTAFCKENGIAFELHTVANTGHSFYSLEAEAEAVGRVVEFA